MKRPVIGLALVAALLAGGLACSSANLSLKDSPMTIAMTSKGLQPFDVVGNFSVPVKASWFFLGAIPLGDPAIREAVEGEVQKAGGDGAVNVSIIGVNTFGDLFLSGILLDLYSCRTYTVEGQVIRFKK